MGYIQPTKILMCTVAFILPLLSLELQAQGYSSAKKRIGTTEATFLANYFSGLEINGKGGSGVDVSDDVGWGFGLGYNLDNHWNVGFALDNNYSRYKATFVDEDGNDNQISHKLSTYSGQFNVQYNFSEGALTPYVQAGLGWTYLDSNIANSRPITTCWWDPWYGYICNTYASTYSENSFSYNTAVGVRWDFARTMFVRGSYGVRWIDLNKASSTPDVEVVSFELGTRF